MKTYIIAEAGVNHNGSLELAKQLIDKAVEAGVDAVKFQTFKTDLLVSKNASKATYQLKSTNAEETQYAMLKKLELNEEAHHELIQYSNLKGIEFLSTPFDFQSIDLLANQLNLNKLKIPSGEITNAPFLLKVAQTSKPVILSTGMSSLAEIELALSILAYGYLGISDQPTVRGFREAYRSNAGQAMLRKHVILLHCTTEYPTPFAEVNLRVIDTLHSAFGLPVGYSDHTPGITIPIAAVARGAVVIEKHFTLDRNLPGPDHKASLEPHELKAMVESIRQVEASLGSPIKVPTESEIKNMDVARKSLVAARPIKKGEVFTQENLTVKRPGNGVSPLYFWDYIGKVAQKNYEEDELIV